MKKSFQLQVFTYICTLTGINIRTYVHACNQSISWITHTLAILQATCTLLHDQFFEVHVFSHIYIT